MKNNKLNYIAWWLMILSGVLLFSCKRNYMSYDAQLKDGLYFPMDSLDYQFGTGKGEDFRYNIPIAIIGTPKDHDRAFKFQLVPDSTTAVKGLHYEILEDSIIIRANATAGSIPIILHRYLDPEITKRSFLLKFKLVENDNFRIVMKDTCRLEFSDKELPRPRWWSERHFGPYSQMLMMDVYYYYWDLENTRSSLFERIVAEYGKNLEKALSFPFQQEIAFIKYVVTPMYEYYKEHPHPKVSVPDPKTLL